MYFLLLIGVASAGCPDTPDAVRATTEAAYARYLELETDRFRGEMAEVDAGLACVDGVVDPDTAGALHLTHALLAFVDGATPATEAALRGYLAVHPGATLAAEVARPGGRLSTALERARSAGAGETEAVRGPAGHKVYVDGVEADEVPVERATVLQVVSRADGVQTWYQGTGGIPTDFPTASTGGHASRGLLVGGLVAGAASAASLVVAQTAKTQFSDAETREEAKPLWVENQVFGYGGYGVGVAAIGLGTSAVIMGRW